MKKNSVSKITVNLESVLCYNRFHDENKDKTFG